MNKIFGPKGSQLATLTVYISERINSRLNTVDEIRITTVIIIKLNSN